MNCTSCTCHPDFGTCASGQLLYPRVIREAGTLCDQSYALTNGRRSLRVWREGRLEDRCMKLSEKHGQWCPWLQRRCLCHSPPDLGRPVFVLLSV